LSFLATWERSDRGLLIRHFALTAAAFTAYLLRAELRVGNGVLWVLGTAALLNLGALLVSRRAEGGGIYPRASPYLAVSCWAILVRLTGGVGSPFIAGFWIEIVLSAMTFTLVATVFVTASCAAALWLEQASLGSSGLTAGLFLHTGFLLMTGSATLLLTRRWMRAERALAAQRVELAGRLRALEKELDGARKVDAVGENEVHLAHSLKNAVHSLRGFVSLIEPRTADHEGSREVLKGLRAAIDQLEELARMSLGSRKARVHEHDPSDGPRVRETIDQVIEQMSASYPGIRWERSLGAKLPAVGISLVILREVLLNLLHNSAEAMAGRGSALLEARPAGDSLWIGVRDHGCGIPAENLQKIFEPGYTTKPDGNGFGLYLARTLLEAHGGRIDAKSAAEGGSFFSVTIPAREGATR
jgi:signal transduction histidine kinase